MKSTTHQDIEYFLTCKRLAMVGVSHNPKDFSRRLFAEFCRRGYDMVPVNPQMTEVGGSRCFARLQDVAPPVAGVLVMTAPEISARIVRDADEAGIDHVWLYGVGGRRAVYKAAVNYCEQRAIRLVVGYCPYMFFPETPFFHRFHGFCMKVMGTYPPELKRKSVSSTAP